MWHEFVQVIVNPNMYPYHLLLGIVLLYWLMAIIGLAHFSFGDAHVDVGPGDIGLDGHDGAIDVGTDGGVDAGVDGHDLTVNKDFALGKEVGSGGMLAGLLSMVHVGQLPLTLILSLIILKMWLLAYISYGYIVPLFGNALPPWLVTLAFLLLIFMAAYALTSLTIRPFAKLFIQTTSHGQNHLIGKICTVKTPNVTTKSGQAEILVDGLPALLIVQCHTENTLTRGSEAVIVRYDETINVYEIRPMS